MMFLPPLSEVMAVYNLALLTTITWMNENLHRLFVFEEFRCKTLEKSCF